MRKRITALMIMALMLFEILPPFRLDDAQAYFPPTLTYGDFFILGNYLDEEIVWRHIGSDGYGDVALSFRVLTSKAYNSKGIKPANISVPDGIHIPEEVDPRGDRANFGSNIWVNSTLRAWLNSDAPAGQVSYVGAPPSGSDVTANAYDGEAGFLSNFTAAERAVMLPAKHAAALNEVDSALRTAGTQIPGWDNGAGLTDPLRHMVTDTVFLPDARLLSQIANDSRLDWTVGYWSTGFHRAGITDSALKQAKTPQTPSGEYSAVDYWTGTPMGSQWGGTHQMQIRLVGGGHSFVNVNQGVMGVRPAFYLNHSNITITGGSGTQDDPYIIGVFDGSFGVTLKGNNSAKLYAPDEDLLQISASDIPGLTLSYIMLDPESGISINNEAGFNAHNPMPLYQTGGKAFMAVDKNCTVWVMAKGEAGSELKTAFASITYKNFYKPVKLYQQGKSLDNELYLYHATQIGGVYGVPLNEYSGELLEGASYDEISVIPQSDALPQAMQGFWTRLHDSVENITLDSVEYYKNPQTLTMRYEKASDMWVTVSFYFVDASGAPIQAEGVSVQPVTKVNWVPQGLSLSQSGLSYDIPDAADSALTPYKWAVYDAADTLFDSPLQIYQETDGNESIGFDPQMPDGLTDVAIRVYYKADQHKVTERHFADETNELLRTNMISIRAGGEYTHNLAPKIDHYVVVGYRISGQDRVELTLDTEGRPLWLNISLIVNESIDADYFYAADTNGDGIPDDRQVQLTTRWTGVYNDERENVRIQEDSVKTVLRDKPLSVANDGADGNEYHVINDLSAKWIFDPTIKAAVQTVTPDTDTTIRFYYNYDSMGTGVPDVEQGVNAKFAVYDGGNLTYPQEWPEIFTNLAVGGTYIRAVPVRAGYVAVGWLLDGEAIEDLRTFGGRNSNQAELTLTNPRHEVIFVYRAAAKPVTIRWIGAALTGHSIEFGHVTVTGYAGQVLTFTEQAMETLRASVSVNEDSWTRNEQSSTVPMAITFSENEQEFIFKYDEKLSFYYDVHHLSSDGKALFEEKIHKTTADAQFQISAQDFPHYSFSRYEIKEFDTLYASGTNRTVTLTPAEGALSLYFYYAPVAASVTVSAVELESNKEIFTTTYSGKQAGQDFSVSAPSIEGWALADGEPTIKTVVVKDGGSTVTFAYVRPESVYINCIELRESKEIVLRTVPVTTTGEVKPPDLTEDYFDFVSGGNNASENPYIVTDADFENGKIIRYFYQSRMMNVRIIAVGDDGIILSDITHSGAARVGEMFTVSAPQAPAGYALADETFKEIYANPQLSSSFLTVKFHYHKLAPGEVTVRHYYMDGTEKIVLKELYEQVAVGSGYTAAAEVFPGFSLANIRPSQPITVDADPEKNVIEIEYNDARKTVTVQITKNGGAPEVFKTHKVPAGELFTVFPPYIEGYSLAGYNIGNEDKTGGTAVITIGAVDDDVTITLNFVSYISITIIGKADVRGDELFRFTERLRYGQKFTFDPAAELPKFDLWTLKPGQDSVIEMYPTGNHLLEFLYAAKMTTVTIRAVSDGAELMSIVVEDVPIGEEFSYSALYIQGYKPVGSMTQTLDSVKVNDIITFNYEKLPVGNVHLILKEDDTNGRIIGEDEYNLALGYSETIEVPDLRSMFYTALSTAKTVTYKGTDITIEYYYEKETVRVVKKTINANDGSLIAQFEMGRYRVGEIAKFYAPSKEAYELDDTAYKLERINPLNPSARAVVYQEIIFYYVPIADSGRLVVEAVNESGNILLSYHVLGDEGESITASAPAVPGYKLILGEPMSKIGIVSGKVTFMYTREDGEDFADLTVMVKSSSDAVLKGAEVAVKSRGIKVRSNTTDETGQAVLSDLPTDTYDVTVKRTGYKDGAMTVELSGDMTAEIKLSKSGSGGNGNSGNTGGNNSGSSGNSGDDEEQLPEDEALSGDSDDGGLLEKTVHISYISGFEDGTVRPDMFITRAETAAIFHRLLKIEIEPKGDVFSDVNSDEWYASAVSALAAAGIVNGYPEGTFKPQNTITRAEFTAIISRFGKLEDSGENSFSDVDEGHWALAYIKSAHIKNWISGYPSGEFKPENPITRAEAVTIVNRILGRKVRKGDIPEGVNAFTDLSKNHWAYENILEAAVEHSYKKDEEGYEIWLID